MSKLVAVAALFVDPRGPYVNLPGVDAWDEARDARLYAGPFPVVAHPPCERWGRYATGGPSAHGRFSIGDDAGCFEAALAAVRRWGGVLEHPAGSKAWDAFGITRPVIEGWVPADSFGGWTCLVDQGAYGHRARKPTWLYMCGVSSLPLLRWKDERVRVRSRREDGRLRAASGDIENLSKRQRRLTPEPFRNELLRIARAAKAPPV